jgi:hypothetical protein
LKKSSQKEPAKDERLPVSEDIKETPLPQEILPLEGTPIEKLKELLISRLANLNIQSQFVYLLTEAQLTKLLSV